MFNKILIANRSEIAVRIHRTCHELGIPTVAVHSTADADALHVKMANEAVCIGGPAPKDSYLNAPAVLAAAEVTGADAIHPGYGFLSENARFTEICEKLGFTFIGPKAEHIRQMGDKINAIKFAKEHNVPTIPGSAGGLEDVAEAEKFASEIGYPVLLKAAAGGGGRGMQVVHQPEELANAFNKASAEAQAAYGDGRMYMEKFLTHARHIEVQVLCDQHGGILTLGERDCSYQRRHQKVLEETPSPGLSPELREKVQGHARQLCAAINYLGAGTVEFLYQDGEFYFIEMNTRLQVEHPVTEMVTGLDLVREQIRIAAGEKLPTEKPTMTPRGHSIEVRINAEHPETFQPAPGKITDYYVPGGPGVRVDGGVYPEYSIPPYYDSMIAKLIVHGKDRAEAVARLQRAVEEFIVGGVATTLPLHQRIVASDQFRGGDYTIHSLSELLAAEAEAKVAEEATEEEQITEEAAA